MESFSVMSVKDWVKTFLLLCIPLVNIVLLFMWAFGSDVHPTKQNFSKAYLIILGLMIVIYLILFVVVLGAMNL